MSRTIVRCDSIDKIHYNVTDEKVTMEFSKALQQARLSKGLTQKELATVRVIMVNTVGE